MEISIKQVQKIKVENHDHTSGKMIVVENALDKQFCIKRFFCLYDVEQKTSRGNHANRDSDFIMICIAGTVCVKVYDGKEEKVYRLNNPKEGLYIPRMIWKEMYDFSENAVLIVASNNNYDAEEYIRDKEQYDFMVNK